ncbi:MAG: hypothetical protein JXR94_23185 [Candidatus Hydrogenedentes bacterium]|nr:hypothetical protein [Candidatus Hydrogenedentota bacterium]
MPARLFKHDPEIVELASGAGGVLAAPGLQGRVFCHIAGELMHRLDVERLERPSDTEFNNLGGNSLWPAPEGGDYAFNYLPGSNEWLVQDGIGKAPCRLTGRDASRVAMEKDIELVNRRGARIRVRFSRRIAAQDADAQVGGFAVRAVAYRCEDALTPLDSHATEDVLLAAWSLEQFPGADGVMAFGKVSNPEQAINTDFYGDPGERILRGEGFFTFALGGEARGQIGVAVAGGPELIGALDSNRDLLILRKTPPRDGVYFNIADNDQPEGAYSAADRYSVFNGGALDFFELETVGPMAVNAGRVAACTLESETIIMQGAAGELRRYLAEREGLVLEEDVS